MSDPIVVAGATGTLGKMIVHHLAAHGASPRAIVRPSSDADDVAALRATGAEIAEIDTSDEDAIARTCEGASCVVSALTGLHGVVVDVQTTLLNGAVKAGVPRIIPSDFALDFYKVPDGMNRNCDLRREFAAILEATPIRATSVLNGMFSEFAFMSPIVEFNVNRTVYFGDEDQPVDITAMDDAGEFTALAAMDPDTPRYLRIAGNVCTPEQVAAEATAATGNTFKTFRAGSISTLEGLITVAKAASFDKEALYPAWQGMQYMHNMCSGLGKLDPLDNARYPGLTWTPLRETLAAGKPDFME